jgi:hypothetical protein
MTCILKTISHLPQETKNNIYSYIHIDIRIQLLIPLLKSVLTHINNIQVHPHRSFNTHEAKISKGHTLKNMILFEKIIQKILKFTKKSFVRNTITYKINNTVEKVICNPVITMFEDKSKIITNFIKYFKTVFNDDGITYKSRMFVDYGWSQCNVNFVNYINTISSITTDNSEYNYKIKKMFIHYLFKLKEHSESIPIEDFEILNKARLRCNEIDRTKTAARKKNEECEKLQRIANKESIIEEQQERARQKVLLAERRARKQARNVITRLEKEEAKMQKRERLLMENEEKAYIEAREIAAKERIRLANIAAKEKIRLAKIAAANRAKIEKYEKKRLAKLEKQEKAWVKKQLTKEAKSKI